MHVTEQVRDEAGVQTLTDAAGAVHRDEGAHDADTSQRQAYRGKLTLQGGRSVRGGAEKLQHPVCVSSHDRVAGGRDVLRDTHCYPREVPRRCPPRSHRTTSTHRWWRNPGFLISGVSHCSRTLPAEVVLHLAGTFDGGLHQLRSPRGPMGWPVVSPVPGRLHGGGGCTEVFEPLRIHCGVVLHPASTLRATTRRRIESRSRPVVAPFYGRDLPAPSFFALTRRRADDEKTLRSSARKTHGRKRAHHYEPACASSPQGPRGC